ncbi:O-antigen ligase family protein [Spirosoma oryzicola]|uniref:O-antigen ligase family protein n=1 Tax=Spirosoma oryzicola TaxID=2898794 RepID=UPI001E55B2E4|nr:O-antigen ligase family protein [Spirosoma oryzicola]UHG92238.1 O-antigen ligase family protein [Spirosoma oryzicola]
MALVILTIVIALLQINSYSDSSVIKTVPIALSALCLYYYALKSNINTILALIGQNKSLLFLLVMILIGNFRSNYPDQTIGFTISRTISTLLLFSALLLAIRYYVYKRGFSVIDIVANFILIPYTIYFLVNFALWISGVTLKESVMTEEVVNKEAVLLSYLGLTINRVQFPLSTGLNNYAVIIGAIFSISLILLIIIQDKKYKLLSFFSSVTSLSTLLLIDSRVAIYFPILICFFLKLSKNSNFLVKITPRLFYLVILGPLFLYLFVPLLAYLPFIDMITRNSEELATGNSRFLIWSICLTEFFNIKPIHLVGYGYFGHYGSGVSLEWADIFSTWIDGDLKTSHNTLFTILFDYGYLGLIIYSLVIYNTSKRISKFWNINTKTSLLTFGFISFNLFAGITETLIGFYSPNYFILFFLFLFTEMVSNSHKTTLSQTNYKPVRTNPLSTAYSTLVTTIN